MRQADSLDTLVVDLCGTLVREDTTRGFVRWLQFGGWRHLGMALGEARWLHRIESWFHLDLSRLACVKVLRGIPRDVLYSGAAEYVKDRIARCADSSVLAAVTAAKDRGRPVYLATASLDPVAHAVVRELGLTGAVCSHLEYASSGLCLGRFRVDVTGSKWHHLCELVAADDLQNITLYTDNASDVDLIRHARRAYFRGRLISWGLPRDGASSPDCLNED